ncbi:MAG TPA: MarR family transcriptional regulator [Beijerinckiaceae bacterium]|nr:MarR family transcriptional regulator [Beijerinckiaceae bacterium]
MPALDNDLLVLLYDVARMVRRRADQMARLRGTTRAQWLVLARLARHPGISQTELAGMVEVEPITVARLIDRLETRGLVERRLDPNDRRLRRLHLTPKAEPLLDEIDSLRASLNAVVTEGLDPSSLACVAETLRRMKANLVEEPVLTAEAV